MARGHPIELSSRSFPTKGDASTFFKDMLNRYVPGDIVSAADTNDLRSLLNRHPHADDKIGTGVGQFEVMAAEYGTQCFCIVRIDGTREDFSYKECLSARSRGVGKG